MLVQLLRVKIQEITVSESNVSYPGSISLPKEVMQAAGIRQFELVHVNNKTNGNRIMTYAVMNTQAGFVTVNGAASRLFKKGDLVHVLSYGYFTEAEAETFVPLLILTDQANRLVESRQYSFEQVHGDD
jgi:aspartate 1-decarboxylase